MLCAQLIVLSIRNANIVFGGTAKHEFIGALNRILNYSRRGKHRRLWRLAVATQPPIAGHQSAPCPEGTRIYQKPTASSEEAQLWDRDPLTLSWFRKAGQTIILNIIGDASVPLRGTHLGGRFTHSCAASQLAVGFHYIGPRSAEPAAQTQSAGRSWVRGYGETP